MTIDGDGRGPQPSQVSSPQNLTLADADIVERLRNWREVHLAKLHILMEQAADEIAIIRSKLSLRDNLEQGLMDGVARLQAEVRRLESVIAASQRLGGCTPQLDCGADRKSVVSERCRDTGGQPFDSAPITITDEERWAISRDLSWLQWCEDNNQIGDVGRRDIATLRGLLERLGDTPAANATPTEGSKQNGCTLTDPRIGRLWSDQ